MNKWDSCPDVIKKYKWAVWTQVIFMIRAVRTLISRWNVWTLISLWAVWALISLWTVQTLISLWTVQTLIFMPGH